MSTGLVYLVANGSATVTATYTPNPAITNTVAVTVSSGGGGGGGVTSVSVSYNSQAAPFLAFTGNTYPLSAVDQNGSPLSGGTWSTSDATNAPVNSSTGTVSPNAGITGATITYLHSDGVHSGTIKLSVLKQPAAWVAMDKAANYSADNYWRANIGSNVTTTGNNGSATPAPTGGGSALYTDGLNEGQISLDTTRLCNGEKTWLMTFPVGGGSPILRLQTAKASGYTRLFLLTVKRYEPGFTTAGNGVGAQAYKDGMFGETIGGSGPTLEGSRIGFGYTNGTGIYEQNEYAFHGGHQGGSGENNVGNITTEWTSGRWICQLHLYESRGGNIMSGRATRFYLGDHPINNNMVTFTAQEGPMGPGYFPSAINVISAFGENYNQAVSPNAIYKSVWLWGCVDGITYGDPFGFLGTNGTPTLTGISGGTVARSAINATVTLTGTNFNANCYPLFSNDGILVQSITISSPTTISVTVNVTAGATTGAGTVSVYNAASQQTTGTQAVTIT